MRRVALLLLSAIALAVVSGVGSSLLEARDPPRANPFLTAMAAALDAPVLNAYLAGATALPDSTVKLGTAIGVQGWAAGDTLVFRYYRADTLLVVVRKKAASAVRDSVYQPAPAYGATANYKGCVQLERGGRLGAKYPGTACALSWTWTYTRPLPVPVLDPPVRIVLRPGAVTLPAAVFGPVSPSSQKQFCCFFETASGATGKCENSKAIPECEAAFQSWLAERSV